MQSLLISISVATAVEVIDILFGVAIGVLAGYYGGWIDQVLARITDVMFAFPGLLFAILLTGIFGPASDQFLDTLPVIGQYGNARLIIVSHGFCADLVADDGTLRTGPDSADQSKSVY